MDENNGAPVKQDSDSIYLSMQERMRDIVIAECEKQLRYIQKIPVSIDNNGGGKGGR